MNQQLKLLANATNKIVRKENNECLISKLNEMYHYYMMHLQKQGSKNTQKNTVFVNIIGTLWVVSKILIVIQDRLNSNWLNLDLNMKVFLLHQTGHHGNIRKEDIVIHIYIYIYI